MFAIMFVVFYDDNNSSRLSCLVQRATFGKALLKLLCDLM